MRGDIVAIAEIRLLLKEVTDALRSYGIRSDFKALIKSDGSVSFFSDCAKRGGIQWDDDIDFRFEHNCTNCFRSFQHGDLVTCEQRDFADTYENARRNTCESWVSRNDDRMRSCEFCKEFIEGSTYGWCGCADCGKRRTYPWDVCELWERKGDE